MEEPCCVLRARCMERGLGYCSDGATTSPASEERQARCSICVDDVYVPEELRSTACAPKENKWDTDENWFKRYEYVLEEIIFAMQEVANDYENEPNMFEKVREMTFGEIDPKTMTGELDTGLEIIPHMEALNKAYHARIQNGLMLFGVFFTSLWT